MTVNIGATGLSIVVTAAPLAVFTLTQFADDSDPLDSEVTTIANSAMGLNGDHVVWSQANPIPLTLNLIAGSIDDQQMSILYELNRVGKNKESVNSEIEVVINYPNATPILLTGGAFLQGHSINTVSSESRMKSKQYILSFENKTGI